MSIGAFLKSLREKNDLTLKELADKSGVGPSTISDIETGTSTNPRMDTLKKLANALGVSVDAFFNDDTKESSNTGHKKEFPIIPEHFNDPEEARDYVTKHQIFGYGGFNPYIMSDEDILNFANEMIEQAELLGYKYSRKQQK